MVSIWWLVAGYFVVGCVIVAALSRTGDPEAIGVGLLWPVFVIFGLAAVIMFLPFVPFFAAARLGRRYPRRESPPKQDKGI